MKYRFLSLATAAALVCAAANGQSTPRRADLRGGGNGGGGRCTVEVVVDGAAQVEIRGDGGLLRNLKGQTPQWRRFECTSPLPPNPADFRFSGVDGRGSQQLIRDPRQGGVAVVQIDDPDNGSDNYKFDITWGNGPAEGPRPMVSDRADRGDRPGRRFGTDQAVELCQSAVRQQAADRYRGEIRFRQTNIDDSPGRGDWVVGTMEVRRQDRPDEVLKFSCSVDFADGRVRSAQIDPFYSEGGAPPDRRDGGGGRDVRAAAIQNCQRAVQDKVTRDGYGRVDFGNVNFDDRPGRNDWVIGEFRATGRYGPESLRFSCAVDLRDGDVKSLDVTTR